MCVACGKLKQDARLAHARLDKLVGTWRAAADAHRDYKIGGANWIDECARELEDVITALYSDHER